MTNREARAAIDAALQFIETSHNHKDGDIYQDLLKVRKDYESAGEVTRAEWRERALYWKGEHTKAEREIERLKAALREIAGAANEAAEGRR